LANVGGFSFVSGLLYGLGTTMSDTLTTSSFLSSSLFSLRLADLDCADEDVDEEGAAADCALERDCE